MRPAWHGIGALAPYSTQAMREGACPYTHNPKVAPAAPKLARLIHTGMKNSFAMFANAPGSRFDVFFYGLNMDRNLLISKGVEPGEPRTVYIEGYKVHLGAKAMLLPCRQSRAYGVLFKLSPAEMEILYADLTDYRAENVVGTDVDGRTWPAVSMVHAHPPVDSGEVEEYAVQWRQLVKKLGFPEQADPIGPQAESHA